MEQVTFEEESSKGFDIKRLFSKIGKNWYWFLLTVMLFLGAAYAYLLYTPTTYNVSAYVLIKHPAEASNMLGGSAFGSSQKESWLDVNNEIFKFRSGSIVRQVVDSLDLDVQVKTNVKGKNRVVSTDSLPFAIKVFRSHPDIASEEYILTLQKSSYSLQGKNETLTGMYNQPLFVGGDSLIIEANSGTQVPLDKEYELQFLSKKATVSKYVSRTTIAPAPKAGEGLLEVTVRDEVPERAKRFISTLVSYYDIANLDHNNQALRKEMDFLNERLAAVSEELDAQAKLVRDFKAGNRVFDVASSAGQLLGSLPEIDNSRTQNMLRLDLANLVESNIRSYNGNEEIVPNSNGLNDPVLSSQIGTYNQLVLQKRSILDRGTAQDPRLEPINGQLEELRTNIQKNIRNIKSEIRAQNNSLATQERNITGRFSTMPEKEKELIELNRVLGIKQSLYTFLLQKKEDKNLELASAEIAESRIVDGAKSVSQYPEPSLFYLGALVAGLLLPALIILVRVLMNNKIETRQDVEAHTKLPIAGEIGDASKKSKELVVTSDNNSPEAEHFRTLRTNISYLTRGIAHKTLLVTSSKSEEGKSFISLNLANSIAIGGKKVALLEFDLRNPGLSKKMELPNSTGIANFLLEEASIEEIIQPTTSSENLFFVSAGYPLPSNPGEIILSERMELLFDYLKENFDVIIIDTPPVGPVSDALTLGRFADISFFVVRHKYTLRTTLKLINKLSEDKKLPRLTLIINGIIDNKEFNYGNDFAYGYGYQADEKKKRALIN